ncbi:MAG TPA: DHA2 family efflux MFS transporter permease subunit [Chloroflexota bacterium]
MADEPTESRGGFDYRWLSLTVTTVGSFLSLLNQTTVNIGLPKILTAFNVDVQQGHWVITGYMIALAVVIPISGFLAEKVGMKRLYMLTLALFVVGSALCTIAWDLPSLILFRVLQGFGGGMLQPLGMAIVYSVITPLERPRFMAMLGLPSLVAPLLGPVAGGYLVDYISWHAMFSFNIPIGLLGLVLAGLLLRETPARRAAPLDVPGFILSTMAFPALLLGFTYGARDGWTTPIAELFVVLGVTTLAAWVLVELVQPEPMLDLRLFANRVFSLTVGLSFVIQLGLFGTQLLLPLFLQTAQGLGALEAGLILMPQGISSFVSMIIAGRLYNRLGPRPLVCFGTVVMVMTTWLLGHASLGTSHATITWLAVARGCSLGFCFMPVQTTAYNTVGQRQMARATALYNGLLRIFASFATAFLSTVLAARTLFHYSALTGALTPDRPAFIDLANALRPGLVALGIASADAQDKAIAAIVAKQVAQQSLVLAFNDVFLLLTVVSTVALLLTLFLRDPMVEAQAATARQPAPAPAAA